MSRLAGRSAGRAAVLAAAVLAVAVLDSWPVTGPVTGPVTAPVTRPQVEVRPTSPASEWETVFVDHFDGSAGVWPDHWHHMPGWNAAAQNGAGQLEVGHVAQLRSTSGWVLPAGTRVRVSASLLMPDTGSNYAALWVQHPNAADPRELDVIESYGPLKAAGAQLGSHICYDETPSDALADCDVAGLSAELLPVGDAFPSGAKPWESFWEYHTEFTVGGDRAWFHAQDGSGNRAYTVATSPDPRRVPGNAIPFHVRLSNKDVDAGDAVPGGSRHSMLVDWVVVQVQYPTAPS